MERGTGLVGVYERTVCPHGRDGRLVYEGQLWNFARALSIPSLADMQLKGTREDYAIEGTERGVRTSVSIPQHSYHATRASLREILDVCESESRDGQ